MSHRKAWVDSAQENATKFNAGVLRFGMSLWRQHRQGQSAYLQDHAKHSHTHTHTHSQPLPTPLSLPPTPLSSPPTSLSMKEEQQSLIHVSDSSTSLSTSMMSTTNPHMVIVGAGPTGLLGAIHIKLAFPELKIVLIERDYLRVHEVRIDPTNIEDKLLRSQVQQLGTSKKGGLRQVPINVLRRCFQDRVEELGMQVISHHVQNAKQVNEMFPHCKSIIIAEGAHSKLRKELFGADAVCLDSYPFQNIVQVQYTVQGEVKSLSLPSLHRAAKLCDYVFEENISFRLKEQASKVTARFFVSDSIYNALPIGNQVQPLHIKDLPEGLKESISVWLNVRKESSLDMQDCRITKFELSSYTCHDYTKAVDGRLWILLGDAAFAVPYFRALNAGAFCACRLPTWLPDYFGRISRNEYALMLPNERTKFRQYMFSKFSTELVIASGKDALIESAKSLVFMSGSVPQVSQINKWSQSDRAKIERMHPLFGEALQFKSKQIKQTSLLLSFYTLCMFALVLCAFVYRSY